MVMDLPYVEAGDDKGSGGDEPELPSSDAADSHEFVGLNSLLFVVIVGIVSQS